MPAFTCDCLRCVCVFTRRRKLDLCVSTGPATRNDIVDDFVTMRALDAIFATLKAIVDDRYVWHRPLSRRLDRCDRVIQNESRNPFGGNVYYVTMQITFLTRKFRNGERNLHCDVVHITTKWVFRLTLDCSGVFAIKAYGFTSSRTMLAFENNVSCSSSACSTPAFCR